MHCEPQQWAASVLDHVSIGAYKKHKSARTKERERRRGRGLKSLTNTKLIENSTRRYTKTNRQRERKGNKTAFYNSFSCVQLRFGGSLTKLVPPKLTTLKRTLRNTQKILKYQTRLVLWAAIKMRVSLLLTIIYISLLKALM